VNFQWHGVNSSWCTMVFGGIQCMCSELQHLPGDVQWPGACSHECLGCSVASSECPVDVQWCVVAPIILQVMSSDLEHSTVDIQWCSMASSAWAVNNRSKVINENG
jgi:hypothetical protein